LRKQYDAEAVAIVLEAVTDGAEAETDGAEAVDPVQRRKSAWCKTLRVLLSLWFLCVMDEFHTLKLL